MAGRASPCGFVDVEVLPAVATLAPFVQAVSVVAVGREGRKRGHCKRAKSGRVSLVNNSSSSANAAQYRQTQISTVRFQQEAQ